MSRYTQLLPGTRDHPRVNINTITNRPWASDILIKNHNAMEFPLLILPCSPQLEC